jgi:hypothetical protein
VLHRIGEDARAKTEADRVRAQGDAEAAKEAARIKAEAEAAGIRAKGEAEAAASKRAAEADFERKQGERPFRERYPNFSAALPTAGLAAAFAFPAAAQLAFRRADTSALRAATNDLNKAVPKADRSLEEFIAGKAPSARAGGDLHAADSAREAYRMAGVDTPPSFREYGFPWPTGRGLADISSVAAGATLPSAGTVFPDIMDYVSGPGPRREAARKEFTPSALAERLMGPGALGVGFAALGRTAGNIAAPIMINPTPKPGILPDADKLSFMKAVGLDKITRVNADQTRTALAEANALANQRQLGDAEHRLTQEALAGIVGKDLTSKSKGGEVTQAMRDALVRQLRGNQHPEQKALPPPNPTAADATTTSTGTGQTQGPTVPPALAPAGAQPQSRKGLLDPTYRDDVYDALTKHVQNGGNIAARTGLTAKELEALTAAAAKDPSILPKDKTWSRVMTEARKGMGDKPSPAEIKKYKNSPAAKFALPLALGLGVNALSPDDLRALQEARY